MAAAAKLVTGFILFAKNEATYGVGAALAGATDAIQLASDFPVFNIAYGVDGSRKGGQYTGGLLKRVAPSGATIEGKVKIEARGSGSAYTATAQVPNLHPFLMACGMSCSYTAGTNVYKPSPLGTADNSAAMNIYDRGEFTPVSGAVGTWTLTAGDSGPAYFEFDLKGLPGTPTDLASPPARTFLNAGILPPKNESIALTISGSSGFVCRNWSYEHGIEVSPRTNVNAASGHNGFAMGRRNPVFKCQVEGIAVATFDPYAKYADGSNMPITLTVGVATNGYTLSLPQAQLTGVSKAADGPVAMWDLTWTPYCTQPDNDTDLVLTFI